MCIPIVSKTSQMSLITNFKTCEICGIRAGKDGDKKRIFMAQFPLDEDRCKLWVCATGKTDLVFVPIEKLHSLKHICAQHFRSNDFNRKKTRLRKTAVPALKLKDPLPIEMLDNFPCHVASHVACHEPISDGISCEIRKHNVSAQTHKMKEIAGKRKSQTSIKTKLSPEFIRPSGRLQYRAYPTLITPAEVSSGSPTDRHKCHLLPHMYKHGIEHDYSYKIRLDHTYCIESPWEISGASRYSNVRRSKSIKNQKSVGKAHHKVTGSSTKNNDEAGTSWSLGQYDDGEREVNSPVCVKSERAETAQEWYVEVETRVCRVCVRVDDDAAEMVPLMRHGAYTPLGLTMLRLLSDIVISPSDALPKQLCRACADEASRAESFLQRARHTQQRLAGLTPAAVAEDVFESSLLSRYLSTDTMAPHEDDGNAFVTLRFDGENLELENNRCGKERVEESVNEEIRIQEKARTAEQTCDIDKREAFEKCEVFAEPLEEVVIQSFEDEEKVFIQSFEDEEKFVTQSIEDDDKVAIQSIGDEDFVIQSLEDDEEFVIQSIDGEDVVIQSIEDDEEVFNESSKDEEIVIKSFRKVSSAYHTVGNYTSSALNWCLSGSSEKAQPLQLPSILSKRRRLKHPIPPLTTFAPSNNHYGQTQNYPPVRRRRRKSPLLATSLCVSDNHEDEQLDESFAQRLCEPLKDHTSPDASWRLRDSFNDYTTSYVSVKAADKLFHPKLVCAHCGYKTRAKTRLRRHMRTRHDRRRAPCLRSQVTPHAQK